MRKRSTFALLLRLSSYGWQLRVLPLPLITFTVSRCIVHQSWSYIFSSIHSSATIPSRSGGCWITTQVLVCCLQIPDVGRRTRARHPQRRRCLRALQGQGLGHRPHEQPQPHNDEPQGRPHTGKRERGSIVSIHLFHFISRPAISTVSSLCVSGRRRRGLRGDAEERGLRRILRTSQGARQQGSGPRVHVRIRCSFPSY